MLWTTGKILVKRINGQVTRKSLQLINCWSQPKSRWPPQKWLTFIDRLSIHHGWEKKDWFTGFVLEFNVVVVESHSQHILWTCCNSALSQQKMICHEMLQVTRNAYIVTCLFSLSSSACCRLQDGNPRWKTLNGTDCSFSHQLCADSHILLNLQEQS